MLEGARTLGGCLTRQIDKRRWAKPELIVLVRSKPEEAVLLGCKTTLGIGLDPSTAYFHCQASDPCTACFDTSGS
jgi:hypothetical protein